MALEPQDQPQVPRQDTPLFTRGNPLLLERPWWLYFQGVLRWLKAIEAQINSLTPGTCSSYISDLGVLSGTTNITSPVATPNEGDLLTVQWQQPAAGGVQVTWDAIFQLVDPNVNDSRPNRYTIVSFKAHSDNLWWPNSILMGRM